MTTQTLFPEEEILDISPEEIKRDYIYLTEASSILGVTRSRMHALINKMPPRLDAIRVNNYRIMVPKAQVDEYDQQRRRASWMYRARQEDADLPGAISGNSDQC